MSFSFDYDRKLPIVLFYEMALPEHSFKGKGVGKFRGISVVLRRGDGVTIPPS